jgi:peptide/nickel transport system permease protein
MLAYTIRRILWTVPIVLGVMLITFVLFRYVAPDPALRWAGKYKSEAQLQAIRHEAGTDIPRWFNYGEAAAAWRGERADGGGFIARLGASAAGLLDSQFFRILTFRFPVSLKYHESVWRLFGRAAPVSLIIQLPAFIIELALQLALALFVAANRGKWSDYTVTFLAVLGMSVPSLSIYMAVQWLFGAQLQWFPIAGWNVWPYWLPFTVLPIIVTVIGGIGGGARFYRTVILEDISSDYVRTARSKGVSRITVLMVHVMRNVMIPVITNTVTALPGLFVGALILEQLFQIPGLGASLFNAVHDEDSSIVMSMVYLSSVAFCIMLLINDLLYMLVDPRVTLA